MPAGDGAASKNNLAINECKKQIGDCKKKIGDYQKQIEDASRICKKIIERVNLPSTLQQAAADKSTVEGPTKRAMIHFQSTRSISQQMQQRNTAHANAGPPPNVGLGSVDASSVELQKEACSRKETFEKPKEMVQSQQGLNEATQIVEHGQRNDQKVKLLEDKSPA